MRLWIINVTSASDITRRLTFKSDVNMSECLKKNAENIANGAFDGSDDWGVIVMVPRMTVKMVFACAVESGAEADLNYSLEAQTAQIEVNKKLQQRIKLLEGAKTDFARQ